MTSDNLPPPPLTGNPIPQQEVDIILLDDNQIFADAFEFRFSRKKIRHFLDPRIFIAESPSYARNTLICIDNDFGIVAPVKGIDIAEQLHELGFTRLYLVSGTYFSEDQLPGYLIFIEKINLEFFNVM